MIGAILGADDHQTQRHALEQKLCHVDPHSGCSSHPSSSFSKSHSSISDGCVSLLRLHVWEPIAAFISTLWLKGRRRRGAIYLGIFRAHFFHPVQHLWNARRVPFLRLIWRGFCGGPLPSNIKDMMKAGYRIVDRFLMRHVLDFCRNGHLDILNAWGGVLALDRPAVV